MPGNEIIEIVTCQQTEFEMIGFWVANLSSLFFFSCLISSNNSGPRQKEPLDRIIILSCWQWEHTVLSKFNNKYNFGIFTLILMHNFQIEHSWKGDDFLMKILLQNRQDLTCPQNHVISTSQHSQSLFKKLETCIFTKYCRN